MKKRYSKVIEKWIRGLMEKSDWTDKKSYTNGIYADHYIYYSSQDNYLWFQKSLGKNIYYNLKIYSKKHSNQDDFFEQNGYVEIFNLNNYRQIKGMEKIIIKITEEKLLETGRKFTK